MDSCSHAVHSILQIDLSLLYFFTYLAIADIFIMSNSYGHIAYGTIGIFDWIIALQNDSISHVFSWENINDCTIKRGFNI